MRNIPDNLVFGRIKNSMQRHGQFNHTQTSAQMSARFTHRRNRLGAQLSSQRNEFAVAQPLHISGAGHLI